MNHYTEEQFNALAPYAEDFRRATENNYVRHNPGHVALDAIREAYMKAAGIRQYPRNWGCTACVVNLFKDAGRLWLEDRDARDAAALAEANDKAAVEATIEDATAAQGDGAPAGAEKPAELPASAEDGKTPAKPAKAKTAKSGAAKTTKSAKA